MPEGTESGGFKLPPPADPQAARQSYEELFAQVTDTEQQPPSYGTPTNPLEPTAATAWQSPRKQGMVVTLPSGQKMKVRRTLDLSTVLHSGKLPNRLVKIVTEMIQAHEQKRPPRVAEEDVDSELLEIMANFIDTVVIAMSIEPRVLAVPAGEDPQEWDPPYPETQISIADLKDEDKSFLFQLAQGGTADVEKFRTQQAAALVAIPTGEAVQGAAEQSGGD